ncbi:MAG: AsmA family protein [Bacteroidales bacterium]|nr:AsmA family protein [Bacteroidales bacterium]
MKKVLKVILIILAVLLVLILVVPFAFQGKITKIAKEQINKNINARVDFDRLAISLIRNFPNLNVGLRQLYVTGIDDFEGDTLVSIGSFDVAVNLLSAIRMENIEIRRIAISEPRIHARVLEDGKVNWDIMKETGAEEEEPDTTMSDFNTKVALKLLEISNGRIAYTDDSSRIEASLDNFNFTMKGDLSKDFTTLAISSSTEFVNVVMGGIRYLRDAGLDLDIELDADLVNLLFTLRDNSIALNDLVLRFDGTVAMPNEEDVAIDLSYGLDQADFKSLLSLIPAIYMKDFEDVETAGQLTLNGAVEGTYNAKSMPDVTLAMLVENAMFKYPYLPKSAENIGIDVDLFFDGVQQDNSTVDINKFHVELGSNPVDMTLNIKTPVSDMMVNGNLHMDLDLATLQDVVPLEHTSLAGRINAAMDFMGYLSYIENEEYEKFRADGSVQIDDLLYSTPDLPGDVMISEASISLSPKFFDVQSFNAVMGRSDFQLSGRVEDFIPYLFKDETIRGDFILTSGVLDLNAFMTESAETVEETDTVPLTLIEVPGNIDFRLVSRIDRMFFDKLQIENTVGAILVRDSRVSLDNLRMNLLNGTMQLSGEYNTKDIQNPLVDFDFNAISIDIPAAFEAFGVLQKFAPIAQKAVGNVSLQMQYSSYLSENMMPVLASIVGTGSFSSEAIGLRSSNTFNAIGNALNTSTFENMTLNNLGVDFEIRNGRLLVEPFEVIMGKTTLLIGGDQGLDETMNYTIGISIPRTELGEAANSAVNNLVERASSAGINIDPAENLNISVSVGGTFRNPEIRLNLRENTGQALQQMKEQAVQAVQEQIDQKKEEARAAARAEADKIIAETEEQADVIRQNASKAADIIRKEADSNAQKLIDQAKDPISRRLAEEAAKKLRQEGEESAQKIIDEADRKADALVNEARERADRLLE